LVDFLKIDEIVELGHQYATDLLASEHARLGVVLSGDVPRESRS
jgi:hypothetical protein